MTSDDYRNYAKRFGQVAERYMLCIPALCPSPVCQATAQEHAVLAAHFALCWMKRWPDTERSLMTAVHNGTYPGFNVYHNGKAAHSNIPLLDRHAENASNYCRKCRGHFRAAKERN